MSKQLQQQKLIRIKHDNNCQNVVDALVIIIILVTSTSCSLHAVKCLEAFLCLIVITIVNDILLVKGHNIPSVTCNDTNKI